MKKREYLEQQPAQTVGQSTRVYGIQYDDTPFSRPQADPTLEELFGPTEAVASASAPAEPETRPAAVSEDGAAAVPKPTTFSEPASLSRDTTGSLPTLEDLFSVQPVPADESKPEPQAEPPAETRQKRRSLRQMLAELDASIRERKLAAEAVQGSQPASSDVQPASVDVQPASDGAQPEEPAPVDAAPAAQEPAAEQPTVEVSAPQDGQTAAEPWNPLSTFAEDKADSPPPPVSRDTTGTLPTLEELFGAQPAPAEQEQAKPEQAPAPEPRPVPEQPESAEIKKKRHWLREVFAGVDGIFHEKKPTSAPEPAEAAVSEDGKAAPVILPVEEQPALEPAIPTAEPSASEPAIPTAEPPASEPAVPTVEQSASEAAAPAEGETAAQATSSVQAQPAQEAAAEEQAPAEAQPAQETAAPEAAAPEATAEPWDPLSIFGEQTDDAALPTWKELVFSRAEQVEEQTVPMDLPKPEVPAPAAEQPAAEALDAEEQTVPMDLSEPDTPAPVQGASPEKSSRSVSVLQTLREAGRRCAALLGQRQTPPEPEQPMQPRPVPVQEHAKPRQTEPVLSASVRPQPPESEAARPERKPWWAEAAWKRFDPEPEQTQNESKFEEAYRTYAKPMNEISARLVLTGVLTILSLFFTLYMSQGWSFLPQVFSGGTTAYVLLLLLGGMVFVNRNLYFRQWRSEYGLRPELLIGIATLFTALDCFPAARTLRAPFPVVIGLLLLIDLWGSYDRGLGLISTIKILREEHLSAGVSEVKDLATGSCGLIRTKPDVERFLEKLETRDLTDRALAAYTPIAAAVGLLVTLFVSLKLKQNLFWTGSLVFLGSVPVVGLLAYPRLFCLLAARLSAAQAALCGYHGAEVFGGEHSILIGDEDLFPPGALTLNGFKVYNGNPDRVIALAAAAFRRSGSALDQVFEELLATHNGRHYNVDNFRFYDSGGIGASIQQDVVLLGSLDFMKRMGVHMDKGVKVKQAVYMSLNGELAAVFAVRYTPPENLRRGLAAIAGNRHFKGILVTRTFLGTPAFLKAKFGIPTGAFHYPSTKERVRLSETERKHTEGQGAILAQDSFSGFAQAAAGGRMLRSATLGAAILAVLGGAGGLLLMGILAALPAYETATALNLLFYAAVWLVPTLLLTAWGRHF